MSTKTHEAGGPMRKYSRPGSRLPTGVIKRKRPPMQPVGVDVSGVVRFQENKLVSYLLDAATAKGIDMNHLAQVPAPISDQEQFAQLIGYSLEGFGDLSYVREETYERARAKALGGKKVGGKKHKPKARRRRAAGKS